MSGTETLQESSSLSLSVPMSPELSSKIATGTLFVVLGALVVASYGLLVRPTQRGVDLWYGLEKPVQYVYYVFMAAAAIGLCAFVGWYCFSPQLPTRGLFSRPWVLPVVLCVALVASGLWSVAVASESQKPWFVSTCLVVVAVSSILMFAGAVEADTRTWWSVGGALAFAVCTALNDAVGWNANYLLSSLETTQVT